MNRPLWSQRSTGKSQAMNRNKDYRTGRRADYARDPDFIARTIRCLSARTGLESLYSAPGSLSENGHTESFHSRLRDKLLDVDVFACTRRATLVPADIQRLSQHLVQKLRAGRTESSMGPEQSSRQRRGTSWLMLLVLCVRTQQGQSLAGQVANLGHLRRYGKLIMRHVQYLPIRHVFVEFV